VAPWSTSKGLKETPTEPGELESAAMDLPENEVPTPESSESTTSEPSAAPAASSDIPKLKLGIKAATPQSELSLDSAPRGRFEGENPNVFDGEDLDLPPFLRKKK
jgi:hypothetical protein